MHTTVYILTCLTFQLGLFTHDPQFRLDKFPHLLWLSFFLRPLLRPWTPLHLPPPSHPCVISTMSSVCVPRTVILRWPLPFTTRCWNIASNPMKQHWSRWRRLVPPRAMWKVQPASWQCGVKRLAWVNRWNCPRPTSLRCAMLVKCKRRRFIFMNCWTIDAIH